MGTIGNLLRRISPNRRQQSASSYFRTIQIVAVVLIVILIGFLVMYWVGNGFSFSDSVLFNAEDFYISVDTPASGSIYTPSDTISIRGGSLGGMLQKVHLWDQAYNVGVPCNVVGTTFAIELQPGTLSAGPHTLIFQAQAVDGRWSEPTSIDISISDPIDEGVGDTMGIEDTTPGLFQPIFDIVDGISISADEGTGDNDLNGDNIDDRLQTSFVSPRYNAFNLPLLLILIVIVVAILIVFLARRIFSYRRETFEERLQHKRDKLLQKSKLREQKMQAKLEKEHMDLQKKLAQARLEKTKTNNTREVNKKISALNKRLQLLRSTYERQIKEEKKSRLVQRQSFAKIIDRLRKEKAKISEQKAVKIFVGGKKKQEQNEQQSAVRPSRSRPGEVRIRPKRSAFMFRPAPKRYQYPHQPQRKRFLQRW